jgi:hypothetical protein
MAEPLARDDHWFEAEPEPSPQWASSALVLVQDDREDRIMPNGDPPSLTLWGEEERSC